MNQELKNFVIAIEEIEDLLSKYTVRHTVGARDPRKNKITEKSVAVDLFLQFRKIRNEPGCSYKGVIKLLQDSNLTQTKKQELAKIPAIARGIDLRNSSGVRYATPGYEKRNLSNIDAFNEIQSTYVTHHDRQRSPIKKHYPDDIPDYRYYASYLGQVCIMIDSYCQSFLYTMREWCEEIILEAEPEWRK